MPSFDEMLSPADREEPITDWHKDPRTWELCKLLIECRDALPAITVVKAKLFNLDLTLADRIESALKPWESDRENAI